MYCQKCGAYLQPIHQYCIKCGIKNNLAVTLFPPKRKNNKKDLLEWQKIQVVNSPNKLVFNEMQLRNMTTASAQRDLEIINESQQLVNSTSKPDVYFSRYDLLFEVLIRLLRVEPFYHFSQGSPSDSILHLCQAENDSNKAFIDRYYQKASEKAQSLKTQKGKTNQYQKFFDSLKPYFRRLSQHNIHYVESLYQMALQKVNDNEALFDRRMSNKNRIQKDIKEMTRLGTDLVTVSVTSSCPVCSKYKGIVYSISGNNKRYHKLPSEIINQTHNCKEHTMSLIGFWEGISTPPSKKQNKKPPYPAGKG